MKILNKSENTILEVEDKARIEKLLGYPDKFERIEEENTEPVYLEDKVIEEENTEKFSKKGKRL